jgi:hypothetical protein
MGIVHYKLGCVCTLLFALAPLVYAQDAKLDRGKYLVENVGLCGDCHTPMLPADPPMPAYSFNAQDAEAILAYLKALP